MAIRETKESARLKLELDGGMNGDKQIIKNKTYSNVKVDVANEKIYGVGKAISELQTLPLLKVKKLEEIRIEEE